MAQGDHRGSVTASVNSVTNPTVLSGSVADVAVGDLIFGVFAQQTGLTAAGTVTDNLGNTYAYVNAGTDAGNATIRCFWSRVSTGGTLTTVNVPATASANDASAIASVIEGPFVTSPLDANPANATDGTSPHACPASGVLAQALEVVMAACVVASNVTMTATSPGSLTQAVARANVSCAVSRTVVAATTSVTPEFGNGATANAGQTTASFKLRYQPLDAVAGSYSVTGTAAALEHDKLVDAASGSYAVTGTDATLAKGQTLSAEGGAYAVTGTNATLEHRWALGADAGSYAVSGTDAALAYGRLIDAGAGSYATSGTDAAVDVGSPNKRLDADGGSYAISGTDAALNRTHTLPTEAGSYAISGTASTLLHGFEVVAGSGSYAVSGSAASLLHAWETAAGAGSYSIAGTNAALLHDLKVDAESGAYAVTGSDAAITAGNVIVLAAEGGSYVLSGAAAALLRSLRLQAGGGAYEFVGSAAGIVAPIQIIINDTPAEANVTISVGRANVAVGVPAVSAVHSAHRGRVTIRSGTVRVTIPEE